MATEIELKFAMISADIKQVSDFLSEFTVLSTEQLSLTNYYYDTPDHLLRLHHCGLRLRGIKSKNGDASYEITTKFGNQGVAGLHSRREYNVQTDSDTLNLHLLPIVALPASLDRQQLISSIATLFTTHFIRHTWLIHFQNSEIEIALDKGCIEHANSQSPIEELELELKKGEVTALFAFAQHLTPLGLRLLSQSKAARGYQLVNQTRLTSCTDDQFNINESKRLILHKLLNCWQKNEEFALQEHNAELLYHCLDRLLPQVALLLTSMAYSPLTEQARLEIKAVRTLLISRPELISWVYSAVVTNVKLRLMQIMLQLTD